MICWLTINRACNLRCQWCYAAADGFRGTDTMTLSVLEQTLEVISGKHISRFILLGGEPTLHPNLPVIIRKLQPHKVVLVTNAIRLAQRNYLCLLQECGLDTVTIALKGATDEQYKENTGVAGLNAVTLAVKNLNELGIFYSISVTFSTSIMQSLSSVIEWMKCAGAETMSINYCRPVILGNQTSIEGMPHPQKMAEQTIASYALVQKNGVKCIYNFMLPLCLLPFEFIRELVERRLLNTICQLQKGSGLIFMPDGRLIPCHHLFDYSFGQVGETFRTATAFNRFWKQETIRGFYKKTGNLPDRRCQECGLKTRCGGGCLIQYLHHKPADLLGQPFERSIP